MILLFLSLVAFGLQTVQSYNRILIKENFVCQANQSSTYVNLTEFQSAAQKSQFNMNTNNFTVTFWTKIIKGTSENEFVLLTIVAPQVPYRVRVSVEFDGIYYKLFVNKIPVYSTWTTGADNFLNSIRTVPIVSPQSGWQNIMLSIDVPNKKVTINSKGLPQFHFPLKGVFQLSDVSVFFGVDNGFNALCDHNFWVSTVQVYDMAYNNTANLTEIFMGAPGDLFGVYKPLLSTHEDNYWFNLNFQKFTHNTDIKLVRSRHTIIMSPPQGIDYHISGFGFSATFPTGFVELSEIDQSYMVSLNFGVTAWPAALATQANCDNVTNTCPGNQLHSYTFSPYCRSNKLLGCQEGGYSIYLEYAVSSTGSINQGLSCLTNSGNQQLNQTISTKTVPSLSNVRLTKITEESLTIVYQSHFLSVDSFGGGTLKVWSLIGQAEVVTPNVYAHPTDIHQILKFNDSNIATYTVSFYEIVLFRGSVYYRDETANPRVYTTHNSPYCISSAGNLTLNRSVPNDYSNLTLTSCNADYAPLLGCPGIPNCNLCFLGTYCLVCRHGYYLSGSTCIVIPSTAMMNLFSFEIMSYPAAPSQGTWNFTTYGNLANGYPFLTSDSNFFTSAQAVYFGYFEYKYSCINDMIWCPSSSLVRLTGKVHQYAQSECYAGHFSESTTAYDFLVQHYATKAAFGQATTTANYYFENYVFDLNSIYTWRTQCDSFDRYNLYDYTNFQKSCYQDAQVTGAHALVDGILEVAPDSTTCSVNLTQSRGCQLCALNYSLSNYKCSYDVRDLIIFENMNFTDIVVADTISIYNSIVYNPVPVSALENLGLISLFNETSTGFLAQNPLAASAQISNTANCNQIDINCIDCPDKFCSACASGYQLTTSKHCAPIDCQDINCLQCPTIWTCSVCAVGFDIIDNGCYQTNSESAKNASTTISVEIESFCGKNCLICNKKICQICQKNYVLNTKLNLCIYVKNSLATQSLESTAFKSSNFKNTTGLSSLFDSQMQNEEAGRLGCIFCTSCQNQTNYFCPNCDLCKQKTFCTVKVSTSFTGFEVSCKNIVFLPSTVLGKYQGKDSYFKLSISGSNSSSFVVKYSPMNKRPVIISIDPSFVQSSYNCSIRSPIFIVHQPKAIVFTLPKYFESNFFSGVTIAKIGFLFSVSILGNSLAQILSAFIDLNIFFTHLSTLQLPIPGLFQAILLITTDQSANESDFSILLSSKSQFYYFFINSQRKIFLFANQWTFFLNVLVTSAFLLFSLFITAAKNMAPILTINPKNSVKTIENLQIKASLIHETYQMSNFMQLTPISSFFLNFISEIGPFVEKLIFFIILLVSIVPCVRLKLIELAELIDYIKAIETAKLNKTSNRNQTRLVWLKMSNSIDEIGMTLFLIIFHHFNSYKMTAMILGKGYLYLMIMFSVFCFFKTYKSVSFLKITQYTAMFGFVGKMLNLYQGNASQVEVGFDFFLLLSHLTKIASFLLGEYHLTAFTIGAKGRKEKYKSMNFAAKLSQRIKFASESNVKRRQINLLELRKERKKEEKLLITTESA